MVYRIESFARSKNITKMLQFFFPRVTNQSVKQNCAQHNLPSLGTPSVADSAPTHFKGESINRNQCNRSPIPHLFSPILRLWNQGSASSLRPPRCPPSCQPGGKDQDQNRSSNPSQIPHRKAICSAGGVRFLIFHYRAHLLGSDRV